MSSSCPHEPTTPKRSRRKCMSFIKIPALPLYSCSGVCGCCFYLHGPRSFQKEVPSCPCLTWKLHLDLHECLIGPLPNSISASILSQGSKRHPGPLSPLDTFPIHSSVPCLLSSSRHARICFCSALSSSLSVSKRIPLMFCIPLSLS